MLFAVSALCFGVTWVTILRYLRSAYLLLTRLQEQHPDVWRDQLGSPRLVAHHRRRGLQLQFRWYLQPLLPFLRWLLRGSAAGLDPEVRVLHRRTRRLFLRGGSGLLVTFAAFGAMFLAG